MKNYKGYEIRKSGEFFEIVNADGKWIRNALTIEIAKEYIDLVIKARY